MDSWVSSLTSCRAQIDDIDRELMACLRRRFQLSQEIAALKRQEDVPIFQPDRAGAVERHYQHLGQELGLNQQFVSDLYRMIHTESCRMQGEVE